MEKNWTRPVGTLTNPTVCIVTASATGNGDLVVAVALYVNLLNAEVEAERCLGHGHKQVGLVLLADFDSEKADDLLRETKAQD